MREGAIENNHGQFDALLAHKAEGAHVDLTDPSLNVHGNAAMNLGVMGTGEPGSREAFMKMLEG